MGRFSSYKEVDYFKYKKKTENKIKYFLQLVVGINAQFYVTFIKI